MKNLQPIEVDKHLEPELNARREVLPEPVCGLGKYFIEEVEMRDGVKLVTKVFCPDKGDTWPTLFTRTPYPMDYLDPTTNFALIEQGYCVVVQGCRGTNGSEGEYEPFDNERQDGIDAINWLVKQPWHNGNIATFGSSYMGFTQWIIADCLPPEVKTMYLDSFGIDRYGQLYMNGMFRHDIYTSWALQTCLGEFFDTDKTFEEALEIRPHNRMDVELFGRELPFYQSYISKTERSDSYWKDSYWELLRSNPSKIDIPVCITEGWFDHNVGGVMAGIKDLRPEIRKQSKIMIGPWDHGGTFPGELEYLNGKKHGPVHITLMIEWFDRMLKGIGKDTPVTSEIYVIGDNRWQTFESWPPKTTKKAFYLDSEGILNPSEPRDGAETYQYDPGNPVGTVGGSALLAWMLGLGDIDRGPQLQEDYSDRSDVLTFKTEPLSDPLTIIGSIEVGLEVATTAPDTAFMVKICEEFEDGRTLNIADGASSILLRNESDVILDYTPGESITLNIDLYDIAWQIQAGSRIRVDVTSSNFPMYHVHPNRAGVWSAFEDWDLADQTVYFGIGKSVVNLPVWE